MKVDKKVMIDKIESVSFGINHREAEEWWNTLSVREKVLIHRNHRKMLEVDIFEL